jgi:hypothetical protein
LHADLLSDTEAEPKLTFLVDNDCNFTGSVLKDAWGDNYRSVVNNIMSYPTHARCRNSFTLQQKAVMLYSASTNKYGKYWNVENPSNSKFIFDSYEPDDYMEMASILEAGKEQSHSFHKVFLKPKKERPDTTDWLKFEITSQDKKNIKITIVPDSSNTNALHVVLYDKNTISLTKSIGEKPVETINMKFENLVSDWYYLHIYNPGDINSNKLDSYSIKIDFY